ncbi:hypothetical protein BH09MYX1_BH09MYX1_25250 [soil metagenome]
MQAHGLIGTPRFTFDGSATYELWIPAPGVILQRVSGKADVDVARAIMKELQRALDEFGELAIFDDFTGLLAYTSNARFELTEWSKSKRPQIRATHILVASKLIAMGVSVASIAVRGLRSYSERSRFEAALDAEIAHANSRRP